MSPTFWAIVGGEERKFCRDRLFLSPRIDLGEEGFLAGEKFSLGDVAHVPHG